MLKAKITTFVLLLAILTTLLPVHCSASKELAKHEKGKGEANVVIEPYFKDCTYEDYYLLAHIINAEAGSSYVSEQCAYGVGSVVLNRVKDKRFPNTVKEVLYQPGQYYNGWKGNITKEPNERSWRIASDLINNGPIFPENVVWQANFTQGRGVYLYTDTMYFCY